MSRKFTLFKQHSTTQLQHYFTENRKKEKKTSDALELWFNYNKLHLYLVPHSLQRTFEQFLYLLP